MVAASVSEWRFVGLPLPALADPDHFGDINEMILDAPSVELQIPGEGAVEEGREEGVESAVAGGLGGFQLPDLCHPPREGG